MSEAQSAGNGSEPFRVAAIGDLHAREHAPGAFRDLFAEMSREARAIILCGDLTDTGQPTEAESLAEDIRSATVPVIAVLGNHDFESGQQEEVAAILRKAGVHLLNGQSFEVDGVGFVGVKGFAGGFGRRMLSSFGEAAIKSFVNEAVHESLLLENAMRGVRSKRAAVVLHYAPIEATVEGEPQEIYPFLGCSRLAETIDRFKVSLVVHGHAHHGRYEGRTPAGIPVYNVAQHLEKPTGRPYGVFDI
jgi:Icc-related predicted phosphoesterase